jgi:hypothetical protein
LQAKEKARMEAGCSVVETTLVASIRQAPNTARATIRPYKGRNADNRRRSEDCGSLLLLCVVFRQKASPAGAGAARRSYFFYALHSEEAPADIALPVSSMKLASQHPS